MDLVPFGEIVPADFARELERELARAKAYTQIVVEDMTAGKACPLRELEELRNDRARLDWLAANPDKKLENFRWKGEWVYWLRGHDSDTHPTPREAIDAAMEAST